MEVARVYRFLKGSGLPLRIPVIEMVEIGAGGGSIARLDALKRIAVGPDSAGSQPGPACYGRGGSAPTVTDADLVLGRIDPREFAGGKIALDAGGCGTRDRRSRRCAARSRPIMRRWASAKWSMRTWPMPHACMPSKAARSARTYADRLRRRGAAPCRARCRKARRRPRAGAGQCRGRLGGRPSCARQSLTKSCADGWLRLSEFDAAAVNQLLSEMRAEAEAVVRRGAPTAELTEQRSSFMRYRGQGHEIAVELPVCAFTDADRTPLVQRFEAAYRRLYSRSIPGVDIEILSWVVSLRAPAEGRLAAEAVERPGKAVPLSHRAVFDPDRGEFVDTPIYWRADLVPGAQIRGPAVIAEDETSTVVSADFDARIDRFGYIELTRRES